MHPLWTSIIEDPSDAARWMVLGDWLQTQNDPRGHLVALQAALHQRRTPDRVEAERRWSFEHRVSLLGPLADRVDPWVGRWRFGYLESLELVVDSWTLRPAGVLRWLGEGRNVLRHLRLVSSANFDHAMDAFVEAPWPWLESLRMGPLNVGAGRTDVDVQRILDAAPRLKVFRVEQPGGVGAWRHPELEQLTLSATPEQLAALSLAGLPKLRSLELYTREPVPADALSAIRHVRLERLVLHPHVSDGWFERPAAAPETLVLYSRKRNQWEEAERRGCAVRGGTYPDASRDGLLTPAAQKVVRRFVREGRFWELHRDGATVYFRYGKVGHDGATRSKALRTPYDAARDYRTRLEKKLGEGYREVYVEPAGGA